MKKSASWIVLAAAAWAVGGCTTSDPADATDAATHGTPNVHVVFANPEKFTDARSSLGSGADPRQLDPLGRFLVREASKQLAPGERLTVVFHDVDLAGDFEPGGISSTGDVRIVREIQPPRLEFSYSIVDQTDTVVQEGKVTLSNRDFLRELRSPLSQQEPLYHEMKMLREWVRKTLSARSEDSVEPASADDTHAL
jgi:hypothetical protein